MPPFVFHEMIEAPDNFWHRPQSHASIAILQGWREVSPMQKVVLQPLQSEPSSLLQEVVFRPREGLSVKTEGTSAAGGPTIFRYQFKSVVGYLLLDEGNMTRLWDSEEYDNTSTLYEIIQGSIFEGLAQIPGMLASVMPSHTLDGLREFLIATNDDCVVILTENLPDIEEIIPEEFAGGES